MAQYLFSVLHDTTDSAAPEEMAAVELRPILGE